MIVAVAAAGVASGCSSSSTRLDGVPLFAASNGRSATTADVEQRDLAPLGASATVMNGVPTTESTARSLRARGWSVENAPIVEVTSADTAVTLSQGYGVPVGVILEANGLQRADEVRAGQRLVIPTYVRQDTPPDAPALDGGTNGIARGPGAPPTTLNEQAGIASAAELSPGQHRVGANDTLWSISQRYGVPPHEIIAANNLPETGTVRFGQVLTIPSGGREVQVAAVDPSAQPGAVSSDAVASPPQPVAAEPPAVEQASVPPANDPVATAPSQPQSQPTAGPASFRWPVRGRLIAGFGKQADGARNDGINLAVPAGTPVRAAESGTVIYAGNELEGYGNLVLVQHRDDWVSAYAHNAELKVARGDTVSRGQTIASVGATGSVDSPQLHFELRKRSKPVDPLPHLADG